MARLSPLEKRKAPPERGFDSFAEAFGVIEDGRIDEVTFVPLVGFQDGFYLREGGKAVAFAMGLGLACALAPATPAAFLFLLCVHFFCNFAAPARLQRRGGRQPAPL